MDERIYDHAAVLLDWSARVTPGDHVILDVGPDAHDLAVAVAGGLAERGATYHATYRSGEVKRAYLQGGDGEFIEREQTRALYEAADVVLRLGGARNRSAIADVPAARRQAAKEADAAVREARYDTRWMSTVHPTRSLAQAANMAIEEYRNFAYGAMLRDWSTLAEEMEQLKRCFDDGEVVRITGGNTDLRMSIADRTAVNSAASVAYDSHNLPSGEVFTAPAATAGTATFDIPMTIRGQPVRNVELTFEDGEVVHVAGDEGVPVIESVLATDEGARRLGELGVGMNRGIDRYTDNILFDEKMAGTIHLALGRAYSACLPAGEEGNDSAVHVDLLASMDEESMLRVDGEVIQRGGYFRWEDEFER